jgi:hypothetical protein
VRKEKILAAAGAETGVGYLSRGNAFPLKLNPVSQRKVQHPSPIAAPRSHYPVRIATPGNGLEDRFVDLVAAGPD